MFFTEMKLTRLLHPEEQCWGNYLQNIEFQFFGKHVNKNSLQYRVVDKCKLELRRYVKLYSKERVLYPYGSVC